MGLTEITNEVNSLLAEAQVEEGICTIFSQHSTAGLIINENFDRSSLADLDNWLEQLVLDYQHLFTHSPDRPDDMVAHARNVISKSDVRIPIINGQLALATWQGLFFWEHKPDGKKRTLIIHISE